jgi:hypothetical protein
MEEQSSDNDPLIFRNQIKPTLEEAIGFSPSESKINKLCCLGNYRGPEIEGYWGQRPLHRRSKTIEWGRSLISADRTSRSAGPGRPKADPASSIPARRRGRPRKIQSLREQMLDDGLDTQPLPPAA